MTTRVLALLEGHSESEAPASTAARLACSMNADLLLGFDPSNEPFERLATRLTRCVDAATRIGAQTSTMLVHVDDPATILRIVRLHNIAVVVLQRPPVGEAADVVVALREAGVAVRFTSSTHEPAIA